MIPAEPPLPRPRGPLSTALLAYLRGDASTLPCRPVSGGDGIGDEDLQLALYCCYELHYRGFESVPAATEWDADVIRFRGGLERAFTQALLEAVAQPRVRDPRDAGRLIAHAIAGFDGPSLSSYLLEEGSAEQFAEFLIHRSAYQLKEADPHTWGIPRYSGRSRAALVEIQADEYGSGVPGAAHADLFATTMRSLALDASYGAYLDELPGTTLATTNLASMFGLHRRWLPALRRHGRPPRARRRGARVLRRARGGRRASRSARRDRAGRRLPGRAAAGCGDVAVGGAGAAARRGPHGARTARGVARRALVAAVGRSGDDRVEQ